MPSSARQSGSWRCYLVTLCLLLVLVVVNAADVEDKSSKACSGTSSVEYAIELQEHEPLGLRLDERLAIRAFFPDAQGRDRAIAASGFAQIGDQLVQVNDVPLTGLSFQQAIDEIQQAPLPKVLRFQTHDGRCVDQSQPASSATPATDKEQVQEVAIDALASESTTRSVVTPASSTTPSAAPSQPAKPLDHLILSSGVPELDEEFYVVLSQDGFPPSCEFRRIVVAVPYDACTPLETNATDAYVIVPDVFGCTAHQKAAFVQESGAKAIVLVQHEHEKPQKIKIPEDHAFPIRIPLLMVSLDSGMRMLQRLAGRGATVDPPEATLLLRFELSEECLDARYAVHPDQDPLDKSVHAQNLAANAGVLKVTDAQDFSVVPAVTILEFLVGESLAKSATTGGSQDLTDLEIDLGVEQLDQLPFPMGKQLLRLATLQPESSASTAFVVDPCSTSLLPRQETVLSSHLDQSVVVVDAAFTKSCALQQQVQFLTRFGVQAVVFEDEYFPALAYKVQRFNAPVPFGFISSKSRELLQKLQSLELLVEFNADNALRHQWQDLGQLTDVTQWPRTPLGRQKLFLRILKDQHLDVDAENHQQEQMQRLESLVASYWKAHEHYQRQQEHQKVEAAKTAQGTRKRQEKQPTAAVAKEAAGSSKSA